MATIAVWEMLSEGAENAKTGAELCKLLNLHPRELTQMIEQERRSGVPICSHTGHNPGYYLAATQGEMQRFCDSLRHRAGEIHKTRRACLRTITKLPQTEGAN